MKKLMVEIGMELKQYSPNGEDYLACDEIIDFEDPSIQGLVRSLLKKSPTVEDYIRHVYEFVRDEIPHSADINEDSIPCKASDVLAQRHGMCFAKSHLLAALLRARSIPSGFCYQAIKLEEGDSSALVLHGLNGVYIDNPGKWIRLDARGNVEGANEEFSLEEDVLAYEVDLEAGEADIMVVYPDPDKLVLSKLTSHQSRQELWDDLPDHLQESDHRRSDRLDRKNGNGVSA